MWNLKLMRLDAMAINLHPVEAFSWDSVLSNGIAAISATAITVTLTFVPLEA